MTAAPHDIDSQEFLHEHLAQASLDLSRELMQMFVNALLSGQADAVCGAGHGTRTDHCTNPHDMSLWFLSSRCQGLSLCRGCRAKHRVEDVPASSGEADEGGVVFLALGSFAVVVGPGCGVVQRGERGEEHGPFELLVAGPAGVLAVDRSAGSSSDRGEASVPRGPPH